MVGCIQLQQPVSPGIWHVVSQRSHPDSPSDSWRITVIACLWSLTSSWSHNYRMASRSINERHRRCRVRVHARARARLYRAIDVAFERLSLSLSLTRIRITLFHPPPLLHPSSVQSSCPRSKILFRERERERKGNKTRENLGRSSN